MLRRYQRRLAVAEQKILAAGFLSELTKAFGRASHCEPSVARFEERQMNYVERDARFERGVDDELGTCATAVVQAVANQNNDASLGANQR